MVYKPGAKKRQFKELLNKHTNDTAIIYSYPDFWNNAAPLPSLSKRVKASLKKAQTKQTRLKGYLLPYWVVWMSAKENKMPLNWPVTKRVLTIKQNYKNEVPPIITPTVIGWLANRLN